MRSGCARSVSLYGIERNAPFGHAPKTDSTSTRVALRPRLFSWARSKVPGVCSGFGQIADCFSRLPLRSPAGRSEGDEVIRRRSWWPGSSTCRRVHGPSPVGTGAADLAQGPPPDDPTERSDRRPGTLAITPIIGVYLQYE